MDLAFSFHYIFFFHFISNQIKDQSWKAFCLFLNMTYQVYCIALILMQHYKCKLKESLIFMLVWPNFGQSLQNPLKIKICVRHICIQMNEFMSSDRTIVSLMFNISENVLKNSFQPNKPWLHIRIFTLLKHENILSGKSSFKYKLICSLKTD